MLVDLEDQERRTCDYAGVSNRDGCVRCNADVGKLEGPCKANLSQLFQLPLEWFTVLGVTSSVTIASSLFCKEVVKELCGDDDMPFRSEPQSYFPRSNRCLML
jgi:hypothetical protein